MAERNDKIFSTRLFCLRTCFRPCSVCFLLLIFDFSIIITTQIIKKCRSDDPRTSCSFSLSLLASYPQSRSSFSIRLISCSWNALYFVPICPQSIRSLSSNNGSIHPYTIRSLTKCDQSLRALSTYSITSSLMSRCIVPDVSGWCNSLTRRWITGSIFKEYTYGKCPVPFSAFLASSIPIMSHIMQVDSRVVMLCNI